MERVAYESWMVGCDINGDRIEADRHRWDEEVLDGMMKLLAGEQKPPIVRNQRYAGKGIPTRHHFKIRDSCLYSTKIDGEAYFGVNNEFDIKIDFDLERKPEMIETDQGWCYSTAEDSAIMDIIQFLEPPALFLYDRWLNRVLTRTKEDINYRGIEEEYQDLFGRWWKLPESVYNYINGRKRRRKDGEYELQPGLKHQVAELFRRGEEIREQLYRSGPRIPGWPWGVGDQKHTLGYGNDVHMRNVWGWQKDGRDKLTFPLKRGRPPRKH